MMALGKPVQYARGHEKKLTQEQKNTFDFFCKLVWVNSGTNLHYVDFKSVFGDTLKAMYKPVKFEVVQQ